MKYCQKLMTLLGQTPRFAFAEVESLWSNPENQQPGGIARNPDLGTIYFESQYQKGHGTAVDFVGLGISTMQNTPPVEGSCVVGHIRRPDRPYYATWARCTKAEMLFVRHLFQGRHNLTSHELAELTIPRRDGSPTNPRLLFMGILLLNRDITYLLSLRRTVGATEEIDERAYGILSEYDPTLWELYHARARISGIYSPHVTHPFGNTVLPTHFRIPPQRRHR